MMNDVYTFWKLLNQYKIIIPSLQRDYAQGRCDARAVVVRKQFVNSLMGQLTWGRISGSSEDLNFIYGKVSEGNGAERVLYPYDGQQRLTTLFLLHAYLLFAEKCLAGRTCSELEFKERLKTLQKFSYSTRNSTLEFLKQFFNPLPDGQYVMEGLFVDPDAKTCSVYEYIVDQPFFLQEWTLDPTVMGMLRMLDEINTCFCRISKAQGGGEPKEFWGKALPSAWKQITSTPLEDAPFRFHFLPMNETGIRDDIYRKMNARGLPLSDCENYKVSLEKFLSECNAKDFSELNIISVEGACGWESMSFHKRIVCRFDRIWVERFWMRYKSELAFEILMRVIARFFYSYAICLRFAAEDKSESEECEKEECISELQEAVDELGAIANGDAGYLQFKPFDVVLNSYGVVDLVGRFVAFMDEISSVVCAVRSKENEKWPESFSRSGWVGKNSSGDFLRPSNFCQRAIFSVVALYDWRNGRECFADWRRLAWNLADRNVYDLSSCENLIYYFYKCSSDCASVLRYVRDEPIPKFFVDTFKEEQYKAKLILGSHGDCWRGLILNAEQNPYVHGSIKFLFDQYPNFATDKDSKDSFVRCVATMNRVFVANTGDGTGTANVGVKEEYSRVLLRAVIANFDDWSQLWHFAYDQRCDETWYRFFREEKYITPMQRMLQMVAETKDAVELENRITCARSSFGDSVSVCVHEDLFRGGLVNWLSSHQKNCILHWHRNAYILYPSNARADSKKFVIGTPRNAILANASGKIKLISKDQQLQGEADPLPYFWGYEVVFSYDGQELTWYEDGRIANADGKAISEDARRAIFESV